MEILIFANKNEKHLLQQCLDWSQKTHIRFQMTFTTEENEMQRFLHGFKGKLIVVNDDKAAKILKKLKQRFLFVKNNWYNGVKYENWG